jgi:hypothetical protein
MADIARGEVSLDVPFNKERTDTFILKYTNSGHRAMEDFLGMEDSEIVERINTGRLGTRLVTGLFWGATRKFHRTEFPDINSVDEYMDEIDDESDQQDEAAKNIIVALVAAYTKSNPSDLEAALMGEEAGPKAPKKPVKRAPKKASKPEESATG